MRVHNYIWKNRTQLNYNHPILALILLVMLNMVSYGQKDSINFSHISVDNGLSNNDVTFILQDRYGFMWFGTEDGVNRYDGYNVKPYRHNRENPNSLGDNLIYYIYEDISGQMWIGTSSGVSRYRPQTDDFKTFPIQGDMFEDSAGTLWMGKGVYDYHRYSPQTETFIPRNNDTYLPESFRTANIFELIHDKGIFWKITVDTIEIFDAKTKTVKTYRPNLQALTQYNRKINDCASPNCYMSVLEDKSGQVWLFYNNNAGRKYYGLIKYNPITNDIKTYFNDPNIAIKSLSQWKSGTIWIATTEGIAKYDPVTDKFILYPETETATFVIEDVNGSIWCNDWGIGLKIYDPNTEQFSTYHHDPNTISSLGGNRIQRIYEDRSGIIWLAIRGVGLAKYDPKMTRFKLYRNNPGRVGSIGENKIYCIYEDRQRTLWIGTYDGGLYSYDSSKGIFTHITSSAYSYLPGKIIGKIMEDNTGKLWIGNNDVNEKIKLSVYDAKTKIFTPIVLERVLLGVLALYQDSSGTIWEGRNSRAPGETKFDETKFEGTDMGGDIWSIYQDRLGFMWFGDYAAGVFRYDLKTDTIKAYKPKPGSLKNLSHGQVTAFCEDLNGNLWIGTADGLNLYNRDDESFKVYTIKDGLPNNYIDGILSDKEGNLWISTNNGLSKFNPHTGKFRNYDVSDGLQSNQFNFPAYCKTQSGEMYFGGPNGLNSFRPEEIKDDPYAPPVFITSCKINDQSLMGKDLIGMQDAMDKSPLDLTYKENFLTFEFAALNFSKQEKDQYAYMMEGIDKDWIYSANRRYVSYNSLAPGEYTFRVKACNADGIWNEQGTSLKISIKPPFWKTWLAYGIYGFLFIGIVYSGIRVRINVLQKLNQQLTAKVKQRTEDLEASQVEIEEKNQQLVKKNEMLNIKNQELINKNQEVIEANKASDIMFSALTDLLSGTKLADKYRIDEKIGIGGFGAVYRATQIILNRPVAIKVLHPINSLDYEHLERFHIEAISACRINHKNAVSVFDFNVTPSGLAYLVMELLEGITLKEELKIKGKLSLSRCAEIILPVCDALAMAHSLGIVHRDIKPDNIYLHQEEEGEVIKVVDFGIAKLLKGISSVNVESLTVTGNMIGTPSYMSPERLENRPFDGRADVYSVGILLYRMLTGQLPFESEEQDIWAIAMMQLHKQPQPLRELDATIPIKVEAIILQALAKDSANRPDIIEFATQFALAITDQSTIAQSEIAQSEIPSDNNKI